MLSVPQTPEATLAAAPRDPFTSLSIRASEMTYLLQQMVKRAQVAVEALPDSSEKHLVIYHLGERLSDMMTAELSIYEHLGDMVYIAAHAQAMTHLRATLDRANALLFPPHIPA